MQVVYEKGTKRVEFTWNNWTFVVRYWNDKLIYRDKAHLYGPWSDLEATVANKSFHHGFRSKLMQAKRKINCF